LPRRIALTPGASNGAIVPAVIVGAGETATVVGCTSSPAVAASAVPPAPRAAAASAAATMVVVRVGRRSMAVDLSVGGAGRWMSFERDVAGRVTAT
jgi:hypothetical protein